MSDVVSRALQLLDLLQSGGTRTVVELSSRLGVDERTVRRDIEHLRALDVPVEGVRGRYGGYRMGSGYRMPPLVLTDDEAVALLLGLLRAAGDPATEMTSAAATARAKIRRALPDATARRFDALARAVTFAGATPGTRSADVESSLLLTVADAVRRHRSLSLRYRSAADRLSQREVHPYDLVAYAGRWYLLALDVGKAEERTFRLDRMVSARILTGAFPDPPARDAEGLLLDALQRAHHTWHVVLRIQATASHIRTLLPASIAQLEPDPTGAPGPWHVATIHASHLDWIPGVILALNCPVVIDEPQELVTLTRGAAARLDAASLE